ncbi:MAG: class II aldolase/adducin family protein [Acholeplasmataceae bacterium]|nr:class II aldolase/adducin family protein [Acholeplasmataceae bacterium]
MLEVKIADARKSIIEIGFKLLDRKLVAGSWGNISMKIDKDCYAITPSGRPYDLLEEEDIVIVNSNGIKLAGSGIPSSELFLHLAIYKKYPTFNAIIHTHSIYASACAAMHRQIPPLLEDTAQISGGSIKVAKYALAGTKELAENAVEAMGMSNAVLLANHGAVICGKSLDEALIVAEIVEKSAHVYCITASIGESFPLPTNDIKLLRNFYVEHYSKRQGGDE